MGEQDYEDDKFYEIKKDDSIILSKSLPLDEMSLNNLSITSMEKYEAFFKEIDLFISNKYIEGISKKFLQEDNIMEMYCAINSLLNLYSVTLSEEMDQEMGKVENSIKKLKKKYTKEDILNDGFKKGSIKYKQMKALLKETSYKLEILFRFIKNQITIRNKAIADLQLTQEAKYNLLKAITEAGGVVNTGGGSTEIQDNLNDIQNEENSIIAFIKDIGFQPNAPVFARNKKKRNQQGGG